jgi:hypothetical protein
MFSSTSARRCSEGPLSRCSFCKRRDCISAWEFFFLYMQKILLIVSKRHTSCLRIFRMDMFGLENDWWYARLDFIDVDIKKAGDPATSLCRICLSSVITLPFFLPVYAYSSDLLCTIVFCASHYAKCC